MKEILDGMARAMFVDRWVWQEEEDGRTYPGQDLMNCAPETPHEAEAAALYLAGMIDQANGTTLHCIAAAAVRAEGKAIDESELGHYLAMMAMGHGVSWFDDHATFPLVVPDFDPCLFLD